jgi:hypothetical protein
MKDETAFDFVAGSGFVLRKFACDLCASAIHMLRCGLRLLRMAKEKTTAGAPFDEPAFS